MRRFLDRPDHILVLVGVPGGGKTHLLEAVGRHFLELGRSVRYDFVPDLLDELRETYGDGVDTTATAVLAQRHLVGVLLLDDIGLGNPTDWTREKITALIDQRYRSGGGLVVATNLTRGEMEEHGGTRLASRLWDRQDEVARVVYLTCSDYRKVKEARE